MILATNDTAVHQFGPKEKDYTIWKIQKYPQGHRLASG